MNKLHIGLIRIVVAGVLCAMCWFTSAVDAYAQRLSGEGFAAHYESDGGTIFLYTQGESCVLRVTGCEESVEWTYRANAGSEDVTLADGESLNISAEGLYIAKCGDWTGRAWCVSPAVGGVTMTLDSTDCDGLYVRSAAWGGDVVCGDFTLTQEFVYQWEAGDSVIVTTRDTVAIIEGLYDETLLSVRAVNQAYNDALTCDTVIPAGVKAVFSYESRKESADNEAISGDESLSAPADVEFTNNSKGAYTVSEWDMGGAARLYDESPVYQFQQPGTYRVALIVTNEQTGCSSSDSTVTITVSDAGLDFPNAFTPNGDGVNDVFLPAFRSLKSYKLTIYNRWGRCIFTSTDPTEGWNGQENGKEAAAGTYYFVAKAEGYERGVKFYKKGSVTLVR